MKLPNPLTSIRSPLSKASFIPSKRRSTILLAAFNGRFILFESFVIRSAFFIDSPSVPIPLNLGQFCFQTINGR